MVAYKGFDKDLTCKRFQYQVGETYVLNNTIQLCNSGFHYCNKLKDCFKYYSQNIDNKFAIVEPLGRVLTGSDKSCTDRIKIVKLLSKEEINAIIYKEEKDLLDKDVFCLDIIRELQSKYDFSIGGSCALHIHGLTLKREKNKIDFDIVMPYFQNMSNMQSELIDDIEEFDAKSSSNDFSKTYALSTKDGRFLKLDIRIKPEQTYDFVEYLGFKYKVSDIMTILEAKCRYAMDGNSKHKKDVLSILKFNKDAEQNRLGERVESFFKTL